MKIVDFTIEHVEQAMNIAIQNYNAERHYVPALLPVDKYPNMTPLAENGLGVTAFEGDRMLGFLCFYSPWDNMFATNVRGTFSPIHAHGTTVQNRERIYKRMYQAAAKKLVSRGAASHVIALYAHDQEAQQAFYTYGFGLRCMDAIRPMERIEIIACPDVTYIQLGKENIDAISPLRRSLVAHLGQSPCFVVSSEEETERWLERAKNRDSIVFVAIKKEQIIAFIEITDNGENFATKCAGMKNICGAFCFPELRGKGIMPNLLNHAIHTLKAEGFTCLGVDFESFNPTAYEFWLKHFDAYTHSVVRRVDDHASEEP
jgi:GNAT superfamily N-acetyltransferase